FGAFVMHALVPALRKKDVVVWDNLQPHRAAGLQQALASAHASLLPLPPYSPDFSPMEPCWSKVKQHLRAVEPRSPETLGTAVADAFASVTPVNIRGWFRHCGFCLR
ncbi:MAG TPA: transposase, partial [Tepidisphaeraceae bacterium]|nr:transposase [Tepidisphaeraceae bacterium]